MENNSCPEQRQRMLHQIKFHEARREYYTESLKPINHLVQLDEKPNTEFMEPKWDLYKITLSFQAKSRLHCGNSLNDSTCLGLQVGSMTM